MLKRGISLLLTMALLCGLLVSPAAAADTGGAIDRSQALDKLSAYDQVFTDMDSTSKDSMPIGNGSMASNVWVEEDGDLVLYLSRSDAYSEATRLLKVGRVRVSAQYEDGSNVFSAGTAFEQKLVLEEGAIYITAGEGDKKVSFKLWIDGDYDVLELEASAAAPITLTVTNDLWRTEPLTMDKSGGNNRSFIGVHINYGDELPTESADVVADRTGGNQLLWYHRNETSLYEKMVSYQKLDQEIADYYTKYPDPYLHNTFGALVEGAGFTAADTKTLTTAEAGTDFDLHIYTHCAQTDTAEEWEQQLEERKAAAEAAGKDSRWDAHTAWWRDVWTRSWIFITGDATAEAVTQGCILQRYQVACMGEADEAIHFNGGLFTMCTNASQGDDYRDWGSMYWHQNTRLVYWPMLAAGDYEFMKAYFDMYLDALPLRKEISTEFFGKEGAYYPEQMYAYGADGTRDKLQWAIDGTGDYTTYHWQNGFEVVQMMLDYYDMTGDETMVEDYIVPLAQELIRFYWNMYYDPDTGLLNITPSNALEEYWNCTNPTDHIAGLTAILPRLLALTNSAATAELKAEWQACYEALPAVKESDDGSRYLPAYQYGATKNSENPELYTVFPYRLATIDSDPETLQKGINTFNSRLFKMNGCWHQDGVQAALLGLTENARSNVSYGLTATDSSCKFPGYWMKGNDEVPDFDNGGQASLALQRMLLQSYEERIYVLPAWPEEWDVDFCLNANYNTAVRLVYSGGQITTLEVESDDPDRVDDIIPPTISVSQTLEFEALDYSVSNPDMTIPPAQAADGSASGGAIVTFKPDEAGESITFTLKDIQAGTYNLSLRLKQFSGYGVYHFSVNGTETGEAFDGSSGSGYTTLTLGQAELKEGENTFTLTVTGEGANGGGLNAALDSLTISMEKPVEIEGSPRQITAFSINGTQGHISGTDITLELPEGTDLTALVPEITVSQGAVVSPESGVAQDFTSPVTYTVTGADGKTRVYTVTVTLVALEPTVEYVDNGDSRIMYTGTWKEPYAADGYYGGDQISSNSDDAAASLTFVGTGVGYVTEISTSCGLVEVSIDGQVAETVDTYTSAAIGTKQLELFTKTDLPYGAHTISIRLAGASGSSNPHVKLDAFKIYTDAVGAVNVTPSTAEVHPGESVTFTAAVSGAETVQEVTWSVSGNQSEETAVSEEGILTVSGNETAGQLVVTATSVADPSRKGSAAVTVIEDTEETIPTIPTYQIKTEAEHGTVKANPSWAWAGQKVQLTIQPDEGYVVDSVTVTDSSGKDVAVSGNTFTMPNGSVTVYVTFKAEEMEPLFPDVPADAWYSEAVAWAVEQGVMQGVSGGLFDPDGAVTRATVWTVLSRMAGEETDGGESWYAKAQAWAVAEGISDGTNPEGTITREQLAAMLYRYSGSPETEADLSGYPDSGDVSGWAADAMAWAVETGLITGGDGGKLLPGTGTDRAQLATILMRFAQQTKA